MRAVVLAYHSHNIFGDSYSENDHVALRTDLETMHKAGFRLVALDEIVRLLIERQIDGGGPLAVGISFDDGPVFDVEDFCHPRFGMQKSFGRVLTEFMEGIGQAWRPTFRATSFVIASPKARSAMERSEDCGYPYLSQWLRDSWWKDAPAHFIEVGNHSWDHVHHAVPELAAAVLRRDDFSLIRDYVSANAEIRRATDLITSTSGRSCKFFAYPFGHTNEYLINEYFPERRFEHGMCAAFGATGGMVSSTDTVWNIPRMVCGHHWRSPEQLIELLSQ